jgi:hypothetical protein
MNNSFSQIYHFSTTIKFKQGKNISGIAVHTLFNMISIYLNVESCYSQELPNMIDIPSIGKHLNKIDGCQQM